MFWMWLITDVSLFLFCGFKQAADKRSSGTLHQKSSVTTTRKYSITRQNPTRVKAQMFSRVHWVNLRIYRESIEKYTKLKIFMCLCCRYFKYMLLRLLAYLYSWYLKYVCLVCWAVVCVREMCTVKGRIGVKPLTSFLLSNVQSRQDEKCFHK